jgi:hypothetical protein
VVLNGSLMTTRPARLLLDERCIARVEIAAASDRLHHQPQAKSTRGALDIFRVACGIRVVGVHEHSDAFGSGNQLMQHFKLFRR